jgi:hypothetical protein
MSNKNTSTSDPDPVIDEVRRTAMDLCHRITSLSIRAIEIDRANEILEVLRAMSQDLEAYEEVCKES